ncbi:MAG: hypothetical protein IPN88_04705 [Bacteroidetes bacterium]|nr:hypothetical protein [Bacteroidota bacterium]
MENPMCIAGVFGGLIPVLQKVQHLLFLESAYFDAASIRKTSKQHGLKTMQVSIRREELTRK